jgi:anti-sigma B factor antagonist
LALIDEEPELTITTSWPRDEVAVVSVHGESDIGTAPLLEESLSRLAGRGTNVVVDLTDVRFFDLTTVRVLLSLQRKLNDAGRHCVTVMDGWGSRVVALAGLRDELAVTGTVDEAVAAALAGGRSRAGAENGSRIADVV